MIPLISCLEKLKDPRKNRGKRYKLSSILICCFLATMCGYNSYSGFSDFCKNYRDSLSEILEMGVKTPCASTFFNILKLVGIRNFEKVVSEWVESFLLKNDVIAIDGKCLRGTKNKEENIVIYYQLFQNV